MTWRCPICGSENPQEAYECRICGAYRPEATTRRVGQPARAEAVRTLVVEVLRSPVEQLSGLRHEFKAGSPGAVVTIGRSVENAIVVPDPMVSRRHLRVIVTTGGIVVEDLGSSNGTFLVEQGGERQVRVENVGREATVRIGQTLLRLRLV